MYAPPTLETGDQTELPIETDPVVVRALQLVDEADLAEAAGASDD